MSVGVVPSPVPMELRSSPHLLYERSYILTSRHVYTYVLVDAQGRTFVRSIYTCLLVRVCTHIAMYVFVIRAHILAVAVACVRVRQTMRKSWCIRGIRASLKGRG